MLPKGGTTAARGSGRGLENGKSHQQSVAMTSPQEPLWKRWLDRLLMLNLLAVLLGAGFFGLAVLAQLQGQQGPMDLVQKLWQPLFAPAISLLIMAALVNGVLSWWKRRLQKPNLENGN